MRLKSFLKLVEIRTKTASMVPFILGTLYALYRFRRFDLRSFLLMWASVLAFDMFTTGLNNYLDYKRARRTSGYNYEMHNAIARDHLRESTVIAVLAVLFAVASGTGVLLFLHTDWVVLLLGFVSFCAGIAYSFGPVPLSETPLGEAVSGFFMGFVLLFLSAYVHLRDETLVQLFMENHMLVLRLRIEELVYVFLFSLPAVCGIANIMLANNICDIDDDLENKRYTLPVHIGRKASLLLFKAIYILAYADILAMYLLKLTPVYILLVLPFAMPVALHTRKFSERPSKKETFVLSVRNFLMIGLSQAFFTGIGILFRHIAA